MKETKRVDPSFLDGKEPIAKGYKIFSWDWTGYGGYSYADENGTVEGSVHTITGKLSKCGWGLHYCENPLDCMRYRDIIQWNKFALVEAYDENIKADGDDKSVCRTLKIKRVLSFDEMIEACKSYQKEANIAEATNGISYSSGICNGSGISYGSGICNGSGISGGYGISDGSGISYGSGICNGSGIRYGSGISVGYGISYSSGICNGSGIRYGSGISVGYGVNHSKHCRNCVGISRCLLCYGLEGARLMIFNKPVTAKRFTEVSDKLGEWYPRFTNAEQLKEKYGNGEWCATPAPAITGRTAKEAYAEMPTELVEYIKSLPEYDDEIFRKITGEDDKEVM